MFAVRGISSTGLPRLPSGVLYDRGLLFSYAAWASGRLFGDGLPSYRLPSLVGGIAVVVLTATVATRVGGSTLLAGILAATATWLVVASTWARFYGLLVAAFMATALSLVDPVADKARRGRWFLAGLVATRLLHEMAITLLALPLFLLLQARPASGERRWAVKLVLHSVAILAGLQLALAALKPPDTAWAAPVSIDLGAGVTRVVPALLSLSSPFGWALLGLVGLGIGILLRLLRASWLCCAIAAACTVTLNLGLILIGVVGLALVRPDRVRVAAAAGAALGIGTVGIWTVYASYYTPAGFNWALVSSLGHAGLAFPLAGAAALADRWPLAAWAALGGLIVGWRNEAVRALAFLALASLAFLGTIALGPKPRYFLTLLPLLFVLAAILPVAVQERLPASGWLPKVASTTLTLLLGGSVLVEHELGGRDLLLERGGPLGLSRLRTSPFERWTSLLGYQPVEGPVVCNDDLGCLLLGQHPTHWWLGSEAEAAAYGFRDAAGWRSIYTGVRILVGDEGSRALNSDDLRGAWVIALATVKYPGPPGLAPSEVWPGLEPVCKADGLLVLRVLAPVNPGWSRFGKEAVPCITG